MEEKKTYTKAEKNMLKGLAVVLTCTFAFMGYGYYAGIQNEKRDAAEFEKQQVVQQQQELLLKEQEKKTRDEQLEKELAKIQEQEEKEKEKEKEGIAPAPKEIKDHTSSKPTPPLPPTIPEEERTNPNSKPEPSLPPTPPSDKPKNGDERINADGEMEFYVKGFGWTKPTGGEVTYSDVELSGEKIGH